MTTWLIMIALGIGTFLIRYSMIGLSGKVNLPKVIVRAIRFIPASMLSALVVSQMLAYARPGSFTLGIPYFGAAIIAGGVAWKTRNAFLTVLVGMILLWVLRNVLGWLVAG